MKTLISFMFVTAIVAPALAQQTAVDLSSGRRPEGSDWNNPQRQQGEWQRSEQRFLVGEREMSVSGPLLETFRQPQRPAPQQNRAQRFLSLPIVNLFVPQPMPTPPRGQGSYFAWGEKNLPWVAVAERRDNGPAPLLKVNW